MSLVERIDRFQQRHTVVGFPLACIYKFTDDSGNYLAAVLTYYTFVSIVPLLLLASTALSVLLLGHPDLQRYVLKTAVSQFPVVGQHLENPHGLAGNPASVIVGIVAAVYGGLGAAQAVQFAANTAWHVPRNSRRNPFKARARSLLLITTTGLGMLVAVIGSAIVHAVLGGSWLLRLGGFAVSTAVAVGIILLAYRLAPTRRAPWRALVPGAVVAGLLLQAIQGLGFLYVGHVLRHASATSGVFATFIGLLAYVYLVAFVLVLGMEVCVVRADHLWPRAVLTPFTDSVVLTRADESAYTAQARAQRAKGFEEIDVSFREHDDEDRQDDPTDAADRSGSADSEDSAAEP